MGHDEWLKAVTNRIRQIRELLRKDGSLWISIDDNELHYLKVACDEIFGRKNFVATIVWEHRTTRENRKVFSNNHEYLLVYAKEYKSFKRARNGLPLSDEIRARYTNPDNDPRGPWQSVSANVQAGHGTRSQHYEIVSPNGQRHTPPPGRCWVYTKEKMKKEIKNNNVWFGKNGNGAPRLKFFLSERTTGMTPETLWNAESVGTTDHAKKQLLRMFSTMTPFDTPKPEALLQRVIELSSDPGDLVLDAYLGSGTTAAVAHKTGRRYIGIECGEHALTLCTERLRQVVDGDSEGISKEIGWTGGGGFDFYSTGE
jgi:adenine-specific DNA-methyltransferase